MKHSLLCLALALVLLIAGVSGASAVELKYKFKKGSVEQYRETRSLVYEFEFFSGNEKATTDEELSFRETVESIEDGNAMIKLQSSYIKMVENGEAVPKSETPDDTFYYTLSPQGRVLSILDADKKPEKHFEAKKEKDLLPRGDVKPGDSWEGCRSLQGEYVKAKYTLEKLDTQKGVKVAVIRFTVEDKIDSTEGDFKCMIDVTGKGVIYFATELGTDILTESELLCDVTSEGKPFAKTVIKTKKWRVAK
ncbi:MAG: hypothetical protein IK083_00010 [Abditibacteriota bacterium]|nr:hypothetical protein [Abditibacteriota bacterium]